MSAVVDALEHALSEYEAAVNEAAKMRDSYREKAERYQRVYESALESVNELKQALSSYE